MTDPGGEGESTDGRIDRRTLLKGTAAAGVASTGFAGTASASGRSEITFCSAESATFQYKVVVTGRVERGGQFQSDSFDEVGRNVVEGACSEGRCDSFLFTGNVKSLRLDGAGKVFVDGKLVRDTTKQRLPNSVTVQARGERVDYKFRVSGRVVPGETADSGDRVDGNVVRGTVGGQGRDDFRYSGAIAFDTADGPLTVTLDIDDP